jgi:hypothetical protein
LAAGPRYRRRPVVVGVLGRSRHAAAVVEVVVVAVVVLG